MRFYCTRHQQDFYTADNHVGRVICHEGSEWHHIGYNFPAERYWEHCHGCAAIWFYKEENFPREKCPACKRRLVPSHLCHNCETLGYRLASVDAPATPAALKDTSCGSCGVKLGGARWHFCLTLGWPYLTARVACPYCSAGFFPATSDHLTAALAVRSQYQRMRLAALGDDRPALVAPSSKNGRDAHFGLLAGPHDAIVLPRAATREKVVQYAHVFRRVFDWPADWTGDLIVERPAIFERDGKKWKFKEIGILAGSITENGAVAEGSTVSGAVESLPTVAAEPLTPVVTEPPVAVAAEPFKPLAVEPPPAGPVAEAPEREPVVEEPGGRNVVGPFEAADPTANAVVGLPTEAAVETHAAEVEQQQKIIQAPAHSVQPFDGEAAGHLDAEANGEAFQDINRHRRIPGSLYVVSALLLIGGIIVVIALWLSGRTAPPINNNNSAPTLAVSPQRVGQTAATPIATASPVPTPVAPDNMKYFPPGSFTAGRDDGTEYERPAHTATINKGFYLDIKEVTCRQYEAYLTLRPGSSAPAGWRGRRCPAGQEELPVTGVSWYEAKAYAESKGMRLPTEMEWEYAARWNTGFLYPWGNEWRPDAVNAGRSQRYIAPADSYHQGATASGLLHMSGNVWEWTSSDFAAYGGRQLPRSSRTRGIVDINGKVIRGGAWNSGAQNVTTTYRMGYRPRGADDYSNTGFRCAQDAQP